MAINEICHIQWGTADVPGTKKFFGDVFGWTFEDLMGGYTSFRTPSGVDGGIAPNASLPTLFYVEVDDIERCLANVENLGGKTVQPKAEIPGMGWFATFHSPDGVLVGLFQPHRK